MKFSVLTLNTWLTLRGISRGNAVRFPRILDLFEKHDFDVIALQEVYAVKYRLKIMEWFVAHGYVVDIEMPKKHRLYGTINTSTGGLLLAAKKRYAQTTPHAFTFTPYKHISNYFDERLSDRGFITAQLTVNSRPLTFVVTHLAHRPQDHNSRIMQLTQLSDEILAAKKNDIMIAGDFNMRPASPEYEFLALHNKMTDAGVFLGQEQHTATQKGHQSRIDQVWYHSSHIKPVHYELVGLPPNPQLSDHYGVNVIFEVAAKQILPFAATSFEI